MNLFKLKKTVTFIRMPKLACEHNKMNKCQQICEH